ncbi:hypothetical protein BJP47_30115 [Paenibacillus odorifer]|nr:hypothetical protein BJP47_30115 [Paenibacillus odorifer]
MAEAFIGSGRPLIKLTIAGLKSNYAAAYPPGYTGPVILTSLLFKFIGPFPSCARAVAPPMSYPAKRFQDAYSKW